MNIVEISRFLRMIWRGETTYAEIIAFLMDQRFADIGQNFLELFGEEKILERARNFIKEDGVPFPRPRFGMETESGSRKNIYARVLENYCNVFFLEKSQAATLPNFSVVIATFNGGKKIAGAVQSLISQSNIAKEDYEIIVVDDGSGDETGAVVKECMTRAKIQITYLKLKRNNGPCIARNMGILESRGQYVCFTDDDCVVPRDWIAGFGASFQENPEIAGVGGWYQTYDNQNEGILDRYSLWLALPNCVYTRKSVEVDSNMCGNTANVCYRKDALCVAGGFNPAFRHPSLDDWELKIRLHSKKFSLLAVPRLVQHKKHHTFFSFSRATLLRGWARFLIYKAHGTSPHYYNTSLINMMTQTVLNMRRVFTDLDGAFRLSWSDKAAFIFITIYSHFLLWFAKYWVPVEAREKWKGETA